MPSHAVKKIICDSGVISRAKLADEMCRENKLTDEQLIAHIELDGKYIEEWDKIMGIDQ